MLLNARQCRYHEAWIQVFKSAIKQAAESIRYKKGETINSSIECILEWDSLDSMSALHQAIHEEKFSALHNSCTSCGHCPASSGVYPTPSRHVEDAARTCRDGIKEIPPFSQFLKS